MNFMIEAEVWQRVVLVTYKKQGSFSTLFL
jgi:hypothetical protein